MNKLAVVVRGPIGTGKSTIAEGLSDSFGQPHNWAVLDDHWGQGERRFIGGPNRYKDLQGRCDPVLIIELAYGDKPGTTDEGATRQPKEWADILHGDGRTIFLVRLQTDWATALPRIIDRSKKRGHGVDEEWTKNRFGEYETLSEYHQMPGKLKLDETVIDAGVTPNDIIAAIHKVMGL